MIAAIRPLIFSIIISCFVIAGTSGADSRQERGQKPHFTFHRGHYFSWAAPAGWKSSETINGLTLSSPNCHLGEGRVVAITCEEGVSRVVRISV